MQLAFGDEATLERMKTMPEQIAEDERRWARDNPAHA
jgi:hypothetical protein